MNDKTTKQLTEKSPKIFASNPNFIKSTRFELKCGNLNIQERRFLVLSTCDFRLEFVPEQTNLIQCNVAIFK